MISFLTCFCVPSDFDFCSPTYLGFLSCRFIVVHHQSRLLVMIAEAIESEHISSSVLKLAAFLFKIIFGPTDL